MTNKPIILAICGKSASGKDTLAKSLSASISPYYKTNFIISDTTRPKRNGEQNGVDYNFLSEKTFLQNIQDNEYFEYTVFRKWYYGTNRNSVNNDAVNIGVFNVAGLEHMIYLQHWYNIIPIYLDLNLEERLKRSYQREHKFKFEFLRRALVDERDFKDIRSLLSKYNYSLTFPLNDNIWTVSMEDLVVREWLTRHRILELPGQKWINLI